MSDPLSYTIITLGDISSSTTCIILSQIKNPLSPHYHRCRQIVLRHLIFPLALVNRNYHRGSYDEDVERRTNACACACTLV